MVGVACAATCADDMNRWARSTFLFTIKEVRDKNNTSPTWASPVARIKATRLATAEAEVTPIRAAIATRESAGCESASRQERVLAETLSQAKRRNRSVNLRSRKRNTSKSQKAQASRQGLRIQTMHAAAVITER